MCDAVLPLSQLCVCVYSYANICKKFLAYTFNSKNSFLLNAKTIINVLPSGTFQSF